MLKLEGMTNDLASKLVSRGVRTLDDLADLATEELVEMTGLEEEAAKNLIVGARAHWFGEGEAHEAEAKKAPAGAVQKQPDIPRECGGAEAKAILKDPPFRPRKPQEAPRSKE